MGFADHPLPVTNPAQSSYEIQDRGDGTAVVSFLYVVNDVNGTGVSWAIDTYGGLVPGSRAAVDGEPMVLWWEPLDTPADQALANGMLLSGEGVGRWTISAKIRELLGLPPA
ncbi:MAG TPA: hypothetical protein VMW94_10800, partial [Actinomycetes bacterium]|nr:hypothetical protein [Actinomycetes bacterium]